MKVKEVISNIVRIPYNTPVSKAAVIMDQKSVSSVLVEKYGNAVGIMTDRDILSKVVAKGKDPDRVSAKDIMSGLLITIDANEDILEAGKVMDQNRVTSLIVTEKGEIVGKITTDSISRNLRYGLISGSLHDHNDYMIR